MDGITRNFITRYDLAEVVRSSNQILDAQDKEAEANVEHVYEPIQIGRDKITRQILASAREIVDEYGIELVDLRIKRINYIQSVQRKVFERMISERKRAAEMLRSEGQGIRAEIEGQKEKELKRITSEAYRKTQKIRGEADGKATRIYGEAYSKDAAFYEFINTLEKYPDTLKGSRIVLSTDSEFLKYLKQTK
jgi:membrane protease subunit HflC